MEVYFLTFGDSIHYSGALQRCEKQAKELGFFSGVYAVDETDLEENFSDFWNKHKDFMLNNKRGFGYWIWKSYLISELLSNIPKDALVFYMDSGCQINPMGMSRFQEYCDYAMDYGGLAFRLDYPELMWTKSDTYYKVFDEYSHNIDFKICVGGINFFKNTTQTIDFVQEWKKICLSDNYHYVDDSPSVKPNHNIFKEHRHDQSVFSLLVRKYNNFYITDDETYWEPDWHNRGAKYPIWATRNSNLNLK